MQAGAQSTLTAVHRAIPTCASFACAGHTLKGNLSAIWLCIVGSGKPLQPCRACVRFTTCHTDVIVTAKPSVQHHCVACLATYQPYMQQPSAIECPATSELQYPDAAAIGFDNGFNIVIFICHTSCELCHLESEQGGDDAVLGGSGSWRGHFCAAAVCLDPRLHRRLLKCLLQGFG